MPKYVKKNSLFIEVYLCARSALVDDELQKVYFVFQFLLFLCR